MSKLPKEKRDKLILVGMSTVVVCTALWLLVINSQRTTLRGAHEQVEKSKDQLARGQVAVKTQAATVQDFEEASRALKKREAAMAAPSDMYSWLIQTLNGFRAAYKVEIPQFGREVTTEVGAFPTFPYRAALFTVNGSAHYHDFGRFLADFENAFPYIRIQNIELEPPPSGAAGSGDSREKLGFKMELVTLVRPSAP